MCLMSTHASPLALSAKKGSRPAFVQREGASRHLWFVTLGNPRLFLIAHLGMRDAEQVESIIGASEEELTLAIKQALGSRDAEAYVSVGSNRKCDYEWCRIAYAKTDGKPVTRKGIRTLFCGKAHISEAQGWAGDIWDFLSGEGRWNRIAPCARRAGSASLVFSDPPLDWLTVDYLDSLFSTD